MTCPHWCQSHDDEDTDYVVHTATVSLTSVTGPEGSAPVHIRRWQEVTNSTVLDGVDIGGLTLDPVSARRLAQRLLLAAGWE